ncbi:MAG TPA: hypothetical protein DCQ77_01935 [Betaproteobacteria bacterium]|nr:hypothetical protein [Betaproteobacteria bacterium]
MKVEAKAPWPTDHALSRLHAQVQSQITVNAVAGFAAAQYAKQCVDEYLLSSKALLMFTKPDNS